ncbi:MAG: GntR family transcriptional regulator [Acidimicrobiia bacterium]
MRTDYIRARRELYAPAARQRSPRRAYDLLRTYIRSDDARGHLDEEALVRSLGMSRGSVREAIHMLVAEGLLSRRPKLGTTVVGSISEIAADQLYTRDSLECPAEQLAVERLEHLVVPCPAVVRELLDLGEERVVLDEWLVSKDGEPRYVRTQYRRIDPAGPPPRPESPAVLEDVMGRNRGGGRCVMQAVPADERTGKLLAIAPGSPVLLRQMLLHDGAGRPAELTFTHYRGDRTALTTRVAPDEALVSSA